ncbi:hypothetical protein FHS10_005853 [Mucilaginibacter dorajii]|nr:hypothetical protein [Mucilaginibacter dorajii]
MGCYSSPFFVAACSLSNKYYVNLHMSNLLERITVDSNVWQGLHSSYALAC